MEDIENIAPCFDFCVIFNKNCKEIFEPSMSLNTLFKKNKKNWSLNKCIIEKFVNKILLSNSCNNMNHINNFFFKFNSVQLYKIEMQIFSRTFQTN